jgi:hypothetical protein
MKALSLTIQKILPINQLADRSTNQSINWLTGTEQHVHLLNGGVGV